MRTVDQRDVLSRERDVRDLVAHALRGRVRRQGGRDGTGAAAGASGWKESQSGVRCGDVHATLDANKGSRRMEGVAIPFDTTQITSKANYSTPRAGDTDLPLAAGAHPPAIVFTANGHGEDANSEAQDGLRVNREAAIAFTCKDSGQDATEEISPTLRSMSEDDGNANGGGQVAIAFTPGNLTRGGARPPTQKSHRPSSATRGAGLATSFLTSRSTGRMVGAKSAVAFRPTGGTHSVEASVECSPSIKVGSGLDIPSPPAVMLGMAVRRLTPVECERLMGFPNDYTLIPYRGKPAADGPRYKALGNSMAVPVMRWIGERIQMVEDILRSQP